MRPDILIMGSGAGGCISAAGGSPLCIPTTDLDALQEEIDTNPNIGGLLLLGGGDVDPRLYGEKPHKEVYGVSEARDFAETWALDAARTKGWAVLGICRGAQLLNVEAGGNLNQDIGMAHYGGSHPIQVNKRSMLKSVIGDSARIVSIHHQSVRRLADGFKVSAQAWDGTVEAIESVDGRCLGVQFHPEMDTSEGYSKAIFRWLVVEASNRLGIEPPDPRPQTFTSKGGYYTVSWFCNECGEEFAYRKAYTDHMSMYHYIDYDEEEDPWNDYYDAEFEVMRRF